MIPTSTTSSTVSIADPPLVLMNSTMQRSLPHHGLVSSVNFNILIMISVYAFRCCGLRLPCVFIKRNSISELYGSSALLSETQTQLPETIHIVMIKTQSFAGASSQDDDALVYSWIQLNLHRRIHDTLLCFPRHSMNRRLARIVLLSQNPSSSNITILAKILVTTSCIRRQQELFLTSSSYGITRTRRTSHTLSTNKFWLERLKCLTQEKARKSARLQNCHCVLTTYCSSFLLYYFLLWD